MIIIRPCLPKSQDFIYFNQKAYYVITRYDKYDESSMCLLMDFNYKLYVYAPSRRELDGKSLPIGTNVFLLSKKKVSNQFDPDEIKSLMKEATICYKLYADDFPNNATTVLYHNILGLNSSL